MCSIGFGFRMLLLRLLLLSSFGACSRFKGLWGQRLREALARRDPGPLWSRGAPQRLYCPVGIGFHLQIPSEGGVRGVHIPDESCWLRVFSVRPGVVGIQGEKSKLFLCMTEGGRVYTAEQFSDECHLRETMEENHYNTYSSALHRTVYLGLSRQGRVKRGTSVNPRLPSAHFLPRRQS